MLPAALLAEDSQQLIHCVPLSLIKVLPSQRPPQRAKCLAMLLVCLQLCPSNFMVIGYCSSFLKGSQH